MKTPEEILKSKDEFCGLRKYKVLDHGADYLISKVDFEKAMKEYARQAVTYALKQAAEKGKLIGKHPSRSDEVKQEVFYPHHDKWEIKIDKSSILSLKEQILKELGI